MFIQHQVLDLNNKHPLHSNINKRSCAKFRCRKVSLPYLVHKNLLYARLVFIVYVPTHGSWYENSFPLLMVNGLVRPALTFKQVYLVRFDFLTFSVVYLLFILYTLSIFDFKSSKEKQFTVLQKSFTL